MNTDDDQTDWTPGLEEIVVAETRLSEVDGANGNLTIAGSSVGDAVEAYRFPELVARLFELATDDEFREADDAPAVGRRLGEARREAYRTFTTRSGAPRPALFDREDAMEALRATLGIVSSAGDPLEDALRMVGAVPVANALWHRHRIDRDPLPPQPERDHAADYLRMLHGGPPEDRYARAVETYMMAVSDHGLNASTFTARVIASTDSDLVSALVGAVGALKGPLHGGAPGPVAEMLDAIGDPDNAADWITDRLDEGKRIMGMGHRVYDVRDPRAAVFETAIEELEAEGEASDRLELARSVEGAAEEILAARHPDQRIRANVEFYTAVLLEVAGVPRELFSSTFAAGRSAGWAAHVLEEARTGRLIRPRSRYVGPRPD